MREIKFRVMTTQGEWRKYSLGDLVCGDAVTHEDLQFKSETWLQFAGLKDKNDVEIYEGDIIRLTMPDEGPEVSSIQEVVFIDGFWQVELISSSHDYDLTSLHSAIFYDEHEIEIIGNMYQNPELLEAPK